MATMNIPARYKNSFINHHKKWQDVKDRISASIGSGAIFAIVGSRGTGKTCMAASVAKDFLAKDVRVTYCKAIEIFMAIRETYNNSSKSETEVSMSYCCPELLIIDESHERGNTEWEDRILTYIIDKRYDAMKDTILISNQKPAEFIKSIGPSIARRMKQTGGILECTWDSFIK